MIECPLMVPCSSPASSRITEKEHAMSQKSSSAIAVVGIDIEDWIFLQHGPLSAIDRDT